MTTTDKPRESPEGYTKAELCEAACIDGVEFDEIADAAGVFVPQGERGDIPLDWKSVAMRLRTQNETLNDAKDELLEALEGARAWVAQYLELPDHRAAAESRLRLIDADIAKAKGGAA